MNERKDSKSLEFARKEMKRYARAREELILKKRTLRKDLYHPIILENVSNDDVVLDVGCGTAKHGIELVRNKRVYIVGIDIDRFSLSVGKAEMKRSPDRPLGVIELIVADANFLPFKRGSIGITIFDAALHHLPYTWERTLEETYRLLEDGGKLILREPCSINPIYRAGTKVLRSRCGLFFAASKDEQRLARCEEGEIAFKPDEFIKRLEEASFRIEKKVFLDFAAIPLKRAALKSRQPYRAVFKLLTYFAKPLDYVIERIPVIQRYCSVIIVVCKKFDS